MRQQDKKSTAAFWLCLIAALLAGDSLLAQKGFSKYLSDFKTTVRGFERGMNFLAEENYEQAEIEFKKCVKKMPKHAYSHFFLSQIFYIKKEYSKALTHIEKAKEHLDFMQQLSRCAIKEKFVKMEEMERLTDELIVGAANCTEKAKLNEQKEAIHDDMSNARQHMEADKTGAVEDPLKSFYCFSHGNILFQLKRFPEAYGQYAEAVRLNPRNWEAYNNLAGFYFLGKDNEKALLLINLAESRGAGFQVNLELKKSILQAMGKSGAGILEQEYPGGVKRFTVNIPAGKNSQTRFYENIYVVFDEETKSAVIIDPGLRDERIEAFIKDRNLTVKKILNTHGHYDHTGANRWYADLYKAEIIAHKADADLYRNKRNEKNLPDRFLGEKGTTESFDVNGMKITVIHTPGHTPGSVCYLVNGFLLSGDTLLKGTIGKVTGDSEAERQTNIEKLVGTIKNKLLVLPENTRVLSGHGPASVIKDTRESNPYLK